MILKFKQSLSYFVDVDFHTFMLKMQWKI